MNGSDTVAPLCAAFRSRDSEWGPVDPKAGRQAGTEGERKGNGPECCRRMLLIIGGRTALITAGLLLSDVCSASPVSYLLSKLQLIA